MAKAKKDVSSSDKVIGAGMMILGALIAAAVLVGLFQFGLLGILVNAFGGGAIGLLAGMATVCAGGSVGLGLAANGFEKATGIDLGKRPDFRLWDMENKNTKVRDVDDEMDDEMADELEDIAQDEVDKDLSVNEEKTEPKPLNQSNESATPKQTETHVQAPPNVSGNDVEKVSLELEREELKSLNEGASAKEEPFVNVDDASANVSENHK